MVSVSRYIASQKSFLAFMVLLVTIFGLIRKEPSLNVFKSRLTFSYVATIGCVTDTTILLVKADKCR